MKKNQRGFFHVSTTDMVCALAAVVLVGGFVVYVALPWLWSVGIKPLLLWLLT